MARTRLPFFDSTSQNRALDARYRGALERTLRSGHFILGPEVERFERAFARFCRVPHAVGVASGTDALALCLQALGIGPGDEVAVPAFTFMGTVDAVLQTGARPFFIDIEPETCTMDPQDLRDRLRERSPVGRRGIKAVIPVHLFGHPCDMKGIASVARSFRLEIVEDCAQAAGARWRGRGVGSFGAAGAFSFFPTKPLGGMGDGGMVTTRCGALAARVRMLRGHGRDGKGRQVLAGRNSRLDALQAALLNEKLPRLPGWLRARRRLARLYGEALRDLPQVMLPVVRAGVEHAFCLYVIRARNRDALRRHLHRRGIDTRVYYDIPVHHQPLHRNRFGRLALAHTEAASRAVLALPLYPEMPATRVRRIAEAIRAFYSG